jgi:hypothetical protein
MTGLILGLSLLPTIAPPGSIRRMVRAMLLRRAPFLLNVGGDAPWGHMDIAVNGYLPKAAKIRAIPKRAGKIGGLVNSLWTTCGNLLARLFSAFGCDPDVATVVTAPMEMSLAPPPKSTHEDMPSLPALVALLIGSNFFRFGVWGTPLRHEIEIKSIWVLLKS